MLGNLGTWALSLGADTEPIKVGVLHSLSGTMAISEVSLKDVVSMAVQEINAKGGVLGRQLKLVIVDPASNWDLFAEKAKQLLVQEKVAVVFGCWTSVSRKSVLPVFEEHNGLLFYPVQYEGRGMFEERLLHRGSGQPAGGAGGRIPDEQRRGATRSSISWELTTSIPNDQQDLARHVTGEESAGRQYHGRVHALPPSGLSDDCRQD